MTIDRAIEIVNPMSEELYSPAEWLEAHSMACRALASLKWIPADEAKPEYDEFVLGVCSATLSDHAWMTDAIAVVEYDETVGQWMLAAWPEAEDVKVSHWMRLPDLPEGVGE